MNYERAENDIVVENIAKKACVHGYELKLKDGIFFKKQRNLQ